MSVVHRPGEPVSNQETATLDAAHGITKPYTVTSARTCINTYTHTSKSMCVRLLILDWKTVSILAHKNIHLLWQRKKTAWTNQVKINWKLLGKSKYILYLLHVIFHETGRPFYLVMHARKWLNSSVHITDLLLIFFFRFTTSPERRIMTCRHCHNSIMHLLLKTENVRLTCRKLTATFILKYRDLGLLGGSSC